MDNNNNKAHITRSLFRQLVYGVICLMVVAPQAAQGDNIAPDGTICPGDSLPVRVESLSGHRYECAPREAAAECPVWLELTGFGLSTASGIASGVGLALLATAATGPGALIAFLGVSFFLMSAPISLGCILM